MAEEAEEQTESFKKGKDRSVKEIKKKSQEVLDKAAKKSKKA